MDNRIKHNNYKKVLHNEISKLSLTLSQQFSKISYYCYELEKLIKFNNRYLTKNIIDRLDRYDLYNYSKFKIIEYLDPCITCPSYIQIFNIKRKLVKLLKIFLQY